MKEDPPSSTPVGALRQRHQTTLSNDDSQSDASVEEPSIDPQINEALADKIQEELWFRLSRLPSKITHTVKIVPLILIFLWLFLLISNTFGPFGYWESFIHISTGYRERFLHTQLAHTAGFDSPRLNTYSLWRGVVVISVLTSFTYISVALLALRHELFHWKPELLASYLGQAKVSFPGKHLPDAWLNRAFNLYDKKYAQHTFNKLQNRDHRALDDHKEFLKVVRCVARNILISPLIVFAMWMALLQTKFDSHNIVRLPPSYVPPLQGVVWYLLNDTFYYFPHRIAHTPRGTKGLLHKVLPERVAVPLEFFLRSSHKAHHRSKANLAIAAWYCSIPEHVLFNLSPAMIGPVATQILADKLGYTETWSTHLITLYVWLTAATATSVLAHTGYRSRWNDPGPHDEHHEYAFGQAGVNFGTSGFWDWVFGTKSRKSAIGSIKWEAQRDRQAALITASKRSGVPLTKRQAATINQPAADYEWTDPRVED